MGTFFSAQLMNELSQSQSHYLQQHATNPVHWKMWSQQVWEQAKADQQLVIVSIGYSACHWCHVMERETFEQEDAAQVMNSHFRSIKVDREEHPDVDAIYMKAIQLMTRQGGWPLNVVCLPDGRPIWGGTYFPKEKWMDHLIQLNALYHTNPEQVVAYAEQLANGLQQIALPYSKNEVDDLDRFMQQGIEQWSENWDLDWGGEARAPKFMMPTHWNWLLHYGIEKADTKIIDHVSLSLQRMSMGGVFDRFNGGFSRYSVDIRWHVPHFEKMAYDNGLLLETYALYHQHQPSAFSETVLRKTAHFLQTELEGAPGMYFGSLDADSLNAQNKSEEGAYYAFTLEECKAVIPAEDWAYFADFYQLNRWAYWEKSYYVPFQLDFDNMWCAAQQKSAEWLTDKKREWEHLLANLRINKTRPERDTKCITAWNAMIATGLCQAGLALGDMELKKRGLQAAIFIKDQLTTADGLMHQFGLNQAKNPAYCDDYAFGIKAYLNCYLVSWEESWLTEAKQLMDIALDRFWNPAAGFFQFSPNDQSVWVAPHYEIEDNVIPSSNAIMLENLIRLSWYFDNAYYLKIAQEMANDILQSIDYYPGFTQWYCSIYSLQKGYSSLQLPEEVSEEIANEFAANYQPLQLIYRHKTGSGIPINQQKAPIAPSAVYFQLCKGKTCFAPISDKNQAIALWKSPISRQP